MKRGAPWWLFIVTAAVWCVAHITGNRAWGGLWLLLVLFIVAWDIDEWWARRRRRTS